MLSRNLRIICTAALIPKQFKVKGDLKGHLIPFSTAEATFDPI